MGTPRVHEQVLGFDAVAEEYEKGRPEYPADAVAALIAGLRVAPGSPVLDLAAGTGKLTRALLPFGFDLVAVEPMAGMRRVFVRAHPHVRLLDGTAEAIPLPEASVDAVVVGQAFHWFDAAQALPEIRRVLRPGGALGLIWNLRDESVPWVARVGKLLDAVDPGVPRTRLKAWRAAFTENPRFTPLEERTFHFQQQLDRDSVVARFVSVSFVANLPPARKESFVRELHAILDEDPVTRGETTIDLAYRTDVFWSAAR
ncbi:MAG: class I SAM-dependent methyltransferase [Thermoplasmata archaeon]|nr:class I SAM-dependent methyltransferase [Thermoplasmata archaeon]